MRDPNLIVGAEHFSDAGVYRLAPDLAIVQTVDFFAPNVDDPFTFVQIAAANALSDCYAMGAAPRTALNIVGFPDSDLELDVLTDILRGGAERVQKAGAVIVGGHSVRDSEVKYGLAVTGTVNPERMLTNAGAKVGHVLVLTKPLGTGFITTASRKDNCPPQTLKAAISSMSALNAAASTAAVALGASAATDITGFGLAVHAQELATASGVSLTINIASLPVIEGALDLATPDNYSRANATNRSHAEPSMRIEASQDNHLEFLFDPQTSGGLLVAIDEQHANEFISRCKTGGLSQTAVIGSVHERAESTLIIDS